MSVFRYLICVFRGHKAHVVLPWGRVNTFNFCRRCGQRVRTYHTPQNWDEVDGESHEPVHKGG